MEVKEISYFELKRHFENNKIYSNSKEINVFDFNNELDRLEDMGIIKQDDGMIIFDGIQIEYGDKESMEDISIVTVHINRIREKNKIDSSNPQYIKNIWSMVQV